MSPTRRRASRFSVLPLAVFTLLVPVGAVTGTASATVDSGGPQCVNSSQALVDAANADYNVNPTSYLEFREIDRHSVFSTVQSIKADALYNKGAFGKGVDVALIDTGVAPVKGLDTYDPVTNPHGNVIHGPDLSFESQSPYAHLDTYNHGTHLASIIAGRDNPDDAAHGWLQPFGWNTPFYFTGIAPAARVVSVKVGDSEGAVDVTQIIAGIDWVVQHRKTNGLNIRVLNLSFGFDASPYDNQGTDALSFAVEQAWKAGIVVVAADGNGAFGRTMSDPGVTSPAFNRDVIAVGADDPPAHAYNEAPTTQPSVPPFVSSSSASNSRDPDLLAPGQSVNGFHVVGSAADDEVLADCADAVAKHQDWTSPVTEEDGRMIRGSGTSQSAAVVSGSVALLLSKHPEYSPDQVKALLRKSATPLKGVPSSIQGRGVIDLAAADAQAPGPVQTGATVKGGASLNAARANTGLREFLGYRWNFDSCNTALLPLCKLKPVYGPALVGNIDIFGNPVDIKAMQRAEATGRAWRKIGTAETWLTSGFVLGTGFAPDPNVGTAWQSNYQAITGWKGGLTADRSIWRGHSWSAHSWSGRLWALHDWSGESWSGHRWHGQGWSGISWAGVSWSNNAWRDNSWS